MVLEIYPERVCLNVASCVQSSSHRMNVTRIYGPRGVRLYALRKFGIRVDGDSQSVPTVNAEH